MSMAARGERLTHRVTKPMLDALDMARGMVPRSRWIEAAISEKLAAGGVAVEAPPAPLDDEPWRTVPEPVYPRRPRRD